MQPGKNIKIFINYFLGPLLFAWLSYSIYRQVGGQVHLAESWRQIQSSFQSFKIIYLLLAFALIFVNWGIEALKWKLSMQAVYPLGFLQAYKAVLSGLSFSVTMPNRVGEYLGRMLYLPEGSRLKTISVTLVGSFAQLLVTLFTGTIGLVVMKEVLLEHFYRFRIGGQFIMYGMVIITLIMGLLYFNVAGGVGLFKRWIKSERHLYLVEALRGFDNRLLLQLLFLSFTRYCVFLLQYLLLFYLFEVAVPFQIIVMVMSVVFLAMAIIPSIALIEVWLRGEIIIMLMGIYSSNILGIGFTSVMVWFLNLILPSIVGSLLLLNLRVFNKRNEKS